MAGSFQLKELRLWEAEKERARPVRRLFGKAKEAFQNAIQVKLSTSRSTGIERQLRLNDVERRLEILPHVDAEKDSERRDINYCLHSTSLKTQLDARLGSEWHGLLGKFPPHIHQKKP